jgi:hypothetical protein
MSSFIYETVIQEMVVKGLLSQDDVNRLKTALKLFTDPGTDLKTELETHVRHQVTVAYYRNLMKRNKSAVEDETEGRWSSTYNALKEAGHGRPTENTIRDILRKDPTYLMLLDRLRDMQYYFEQLSSLYDALVVRARMLEQLSNNARADLKSETEDAA